MKVMRRSLLLTRCLNEGKNGSPPPGVGGLAVRDLERGEIVPASSVCVWVGL
jgi:hypothetical protein